MEGLEGMFYMGFFKGRGGEIFKCEGGVKWKVFVFLYLIMFVQIKGRYWGGSNQGFRGGGEIRGG